MQTSPIEKKAVTPSTRVDRESRAKDEKIEGREGRPNKLSDVRQKSKLEDVLVNNFLAKGG